MNWHGKSNDATGLRIDMVAFLDSGGRPTVTLECSRELLAGDRRHTAISITRPAEPFDPGSISTDRQASTAS